jgi:hypothetical protein
MSMSMSMSMSMFWCLVLSYYYYFWIKSIILILRLIDFHLRPSFFKKTKIKTKKKFEFVARLDDQLSSSNSKVKASLCLRSLSLFPSISGLLGFLKFDRFDSIT